MRVEHFVIDSARAHGTKTALVTERRRLSYAELDDLSSRLAATLAANGVKRGDRVLVFMDNCWEAAVSIFATLKAGATFSPINASTKADKLAYIIEDCEAAAILTQARLMPVVTQARAAGPGRPLFVAAVQAAPGQAIEGAADFEACLAAEPTPVAHGGIDIDLAMLIYTSGSTGRPKGAMHAHRDMATGIDTYAAHVLGLEPGDRCHSAARLFTSLGFGNGFFRVLGRGATCVLSGARPNPRTTLGVVRDHGVTVLTGVPTFWAQLAEFLSRHPMPGALDGVRLAVASGDSLPAPVAARLEELTGLRIVEGLGCSECSNVLISTRPGQRGGGTLGTIVPGVEVELRDPDGRVTGDGEPGRLWIRSASNTSGYWRRSELTKDLVHGDWIRMGDVLVQEGGVYRHVGRVDDLFKVDARWVSPTEVEACLLAHPAVREAAVAGVPDDAGLLRVHAWVVVDGAPGDGLPAELRRHVARALAPYMAPQAVTVLDALPRLPSGKLDRRTLRTSGGTA